MVDLISLSIRHQVLIEGLKTAQGANLVAALSQVQTLIKSRLDQLNYDELGDMSKKELNKLLMDLRKLSTSVFNSYLDDLIRWLASYINADRDFWTKAYTQYKIELPTNNEKKNHWLALFGGAASAAAILAKAEKRPMGANGILPIDFLKGYGTNIGLRASQLTMQAYINNDKKSVLIDQLMGAKGKTKTSLGNSDLISKLASQGKAVTNTVIQHISASTNAAVATQGFDQYLWVSVLDSHTTVICMDRNGNVYTYGEGPQPPAHIGCRSSTIAWDGTGPVTMPSFNVWANGQSTEYMNLAFDGKSSTSYEGASPLSLQQFQDAEQLIIG